MIPRAITLELKMTTTIISDEEQTHTTESPGRLLARLREQKNFTQEFVANKLYLRTQVIARLEADEYQQMPEPVFIKGYIRAYAKLLDIDPQPLLSHFDNYYTLEKKSDRTLWQSKREPNKSEQWVKWAAAFIILMAVVAISFWWQKSKENSKEPALASLTHVQEKQSKKSNFATVNRLQSMFATEKSDKSAAES